MLFSLALAACATGTSRTPPVTQNPLEGFRAPGLSSGDVLDIVFFRTGRSAGSDYRIQPGDRIRVDVFGHPDLSRENVLVLPDGTLSLNGVPSLSAVGLTPRELSGRLADAYRRRQIRDPVVAVSLTEADIRVGSLTRLANDNQGRFLVEVNRGGSIDLPYIQPIAFPSTLEQLQREVQLAYDSIFGGSVEVTVNLRDRLDPRVFVLGEVETAGQVAYRSPMTAFMAISGAGGFTPAANASQVRLLRLGPDGRLVTRRLALRRGFEGALRIDEEIALLDNDIIYVPATGVAITNQRIEQYIRNMLPTAVGFGLAYDVN
jgi:protein involved in polysaccharide export with SLBB domain